tara:strand:- start:552 stop:1043 length:492 start_codon:yes stop_codon:yes gene_type:complete
MGLKKDLIDAKVKAAKDTGIKEPLDTKPGSYIEREAHYVMEAIVKFMTEAEFRITQLNAPVVLEDFKIPPQQGTVLPTVLSTHTDLDTGLPITSRVIVGKDGVITDNIDVDKNGGGSGNLVATGYSYIGKDPDSQDGFDVEGPSGQQEFTTVKLLPRDVLELL